MAGIRVLYAGTSYPAEPVAGGAAYEIFSDGPAEGFVLGRGGRHRRFVHASEVSAVEGTVELAADQPLTAPVSRAVGWEQIQRLSQGRVRNPLLAAVRASATVRRGTRMVKPLSARQVAGYLGGWQPHGFCYRQYDVAHLRTPAGLVILSGTGEPPGEVAFALRWRAVDASDYHVPAAAYAGLTALPPHDRVGPPVLGTGFAPSGSQLIPEFVTADLADLPLPANAALLAYTEDASEVVLYTYQPEQRGWLRMAGPQWRQLLAALPGVAPDQEYLPVPAGAGPSRLVGRYQGAEYEAVADPPEEFRVLAMTRAARYQVESLSRRTPYATWRGTACTVVRSEGAWSRLRLCRPEPDAVAALGAQCYERGVYEAWAPTAEIGDAVEADFPYPMADQ
ncbi:hypothetical protein [Rhizomonospora bruguierae]|uniref:hypothetical protein n=1 Tax=Rhizomonospora bruguierae TaxID=1581705 RepID=UPI001BCE7BBB|nr:hypothetical protein [Micromonospora sp. NBRC 107566]